MMHRFANCAMDFTSMLLHSLFTIFTDISLYHVLFLFGSNSMTLNTLFEVTGVRNILQLTLENVVHFFWKSVIKISLKCYFCLVSDNLISMAKSYAVYSFFYIWIISYILQCFTLLP